MKPYAVIYESRTGFAKRYAQWLADSLGCSFQRLSDVSEEAPEARTIVLCGSIYLGGILGAKEFCRLMEAYPKRRYAVVYIGATPMPNIYGSASASETMFYHCFPQDKFPNLAWCYCQGGYLPGKQRMIDTLFIKLYAALLPLRAKHEPDKPFLQMRSDLKNGFDGCHRGYLEDLVSYLQSDAVEPSQQNLTVDLP